MNAPDILKYGHLTVLRSIEGLPDSDWDVPGVCGHWSVKDIIAHLASSEYLLVEALSTLLDPNTPTPYLMKYGQQGLGFNDTEVDARKDHPYQQILTEYTEQAEKAMHILPQIPVATLRTNGIFPWYGEAYDAEDFIVYAFYAHKREHTAEINHFRSGRA